MVVQIQACEKHLFQTLKGQIQIEVRVYLTIGSVEFQTLKGQIQISIDFLISFFNPSVSNPKRANSNLRSVTKCTIHMQFQTLKGQIQI